MVLTSASISPAPPPSTMINAIPGAPVLSGLAFLQFPRIPAAFSIPRGAFRLTIGYPCLAIFPLGRRVRIRCYEDVLAHRVATRSE